jgi:sulfur carrier protein ThiS adenylyltransferase
MNDSDRYARQRDIVPADRLAACRPTVIGVGAIGRQVALQLAAMGVSWLQLIDPDVVEPSNLCSQGYLEKDLGKFKVDATSDLCREINRGLGSYPYAVAARFRRSMQIGSSVFCCVDHIETRRKIWEAVQRKIDFFCDGRMAAEVLRVVTVADSNSRRHYPTTLFAGEDAYAGSCTAKSTIYCANIAAGLMLSQFAKWLRRLPVDFDFQLNLLSAELAVDQPIGNAIGEPQKGANSDGPSFGQSDQFVPVV